MVTVTVLSQYSVINECWLSARANDTGPVIDVNVTKPDHATLVSGSQHGSVGDKHASHGTGLMSHTVTKCCVATTDRPTQTHNELLALISNKGLLASPLDGSLHALHLT